MFIRQIKKKNGPNGKEFSQFSLVQNSRVNGVVKQRNLLYLGSDPALLDKDIRTIILQILKSKIFGQDDFFPIDVPKDVRALSESYYNKYLADYGNDPEGHKVSIPPAAPKADYHKVDLSTLSFKDVKSFGIENLCHQMMQKLDLEPCLARLNWKKEDIDKAIIAICARAIFACSEHKTAQYLSDNSELTSLFSKETYQLTHRHLYSIADKLYAHKETIDNHLYNHVCQWFNLDDKLLIFDISNTYFESPKRGSKLAGYGRNKEKRTDCKMVVFTGVINAQGFIKHSRIYEGNTPDVGTLEDMINDLEKQCPNGIKKTVVIDAGIASEDNLKMLREKGHHYVCVSRASLKDYTLDKETLIQATLKDKEKTQIGLSIVKQDKFPDTFMYIKSPGKAKKEASMNEKLSTRFTEELDSLRAGLSKKGTVKKAVKVYERLGRLKQKHKYVSGLYEVNVIQSGDNATDIIYSRRTTPEKDDKLKGVYFIRTNLDHHNEKQLWDIYNTIREVESTFRCLKSDLNIRPIFHQTDARIESHIYTTTLAYQLVNTIRYLLKQKEINYDWKNIKRIMNTQIIHTFIVNTDTKTKHIRAVSEPTEKAKAIYDACKCKSTIKRKQKYVVYH